MYILQTVSLVTCISLKQSPLLHVYPPKQSPGLHVYPSNSLPGYMYITPNSLPVYIYITQTVCLVTCMYIPQTVSLVTCISFKQCTAVSLVMHLSTWILWPSGWPKEFQLSKGLFVRIPTLPLAFTVRIISLTIYISTICNVRMMSEWIEFPIRLDRPLVISLPMKWPCTYYWQWYEQHLEWVCNYFKLSI